MSISIEEALGIQQKPTLLTLTPKQINIQERTDYIIEQLLNGKPVKCIAEELELDRSTIYEYFNEWIKTKQANYLILEWHNQYKQLKNDSKNQSKAFEALTKLVMKILEKQAKVEVNVTQNNLTKNDVQVNVTNLLKEYDSLFKEATVPNNNSAK
jgi:IS30 family transposase